MNYTIRPIGPEDAADTAALRRMPGVFENTLGFDLSYRVSADSDLMIRLYSLIIEDDFENEFVYFQRPTYCN